MKLLLTAILIFINLSLADKIKISGKQFKKTIVLSSDGKTYKTTYTLANN